MKEKVKDPQTEKPRSRGGQGKAGDHQRLLIGFRVAVYRKRQNRKFERTQALKIGRCVVLFASVYGKYQGIRKVAVSGSGRTSREAEVKLAQNTGGVARNDPRCPDRLKSGGLYFFHNKLLACAVPTQRSPGPPAGARRLYPALPIESPPD